MVKTFEIRLFFILCIVLINPELLFGEEPWVDIVKKRANESPLYPVSTLIFLGAIVHTFFTPFFSRLAAKKTKAHQKKITAGKAPVHSTSFGAGLASSLGEIEVVFGVWALFLSAAVVWSKNWESLIEYLSDEVGYVEPVFVGVVMFIASTRPVLKLAEIFLWKIAKWGGGSLKTWWFVILSVGPLAGSLITEPAAMTICAHLLAAKFFDMKTSRSLRYATVALLFINISLGGTLTHFAAVPVILVSSSWQWGTPEMFFLFGWKSILIILIVNTVYYLLFRKEFSRLEKTFEQLSKSKKIVGLYIDRESIERKIILMEKEAVKEAGFFKRVDQKYGRLKEKMKQSILKKAPSEGVDPKIIDHLVENTLDEIKKHELEKTIPGITEGKEADALDEHWDNRDDWVPLWVMAVHIGFLVWTVANAHVPVLFLAGFLFLMGFARITPQYQNRINMKPALMVAFFLSSLAIHGGMQSWWIAPLLVHLGELSLLAGTMALTAFNDNAAIMQLAIGVSDFPQNLKYIVLAGALGGGGLTVIANAPNPAGLSILKQYSKAGFSSASVFAWAIFPALVAGAVFYFVR